MSSNVLDDKVIKPSQKKFPTSILQNSSPILFLTNDIHIYDFQFFFCMNWKLTLTWVNNFAKHKWVLGNFSF